ncbi:amidohydrolase family protein [Agromyces cerinus]|uniref:L-fuconolactonase n=1 Tax=Agromyces cerinus subsp. cerinus TaxID=232089 RepID=A0A1N6HB74_9MICO|nr:amidohydrolase family protein [Agromyces cerinus]SIO17042.1 L-fuconolactonase [Agromyces cerinus subsp. cerinus]
MTGIVDAHAHVWDTTRLDYPWLAGLDVLDRPLLPRDLDRADGQVTAAIFVQAGCADSQSLDEAKWVGGLDEEWPELVAIVAAADLLAPETLEAHLDALDGVGRVVGIRHLLQGESPAVFADPALLESLRLLAARGLSFDACVTHSQLPDLTALLRGVPELDVVLDHLGKPPVDAGAGTAAGHAWAQAVTELAALPGTAVKLSGLAAEASGTETFEANADAFIEHAYAAFGPARSMLGSDWPVSRYVGAGGTFADWIDRVHRVTGATGSERAQLDRETALRFYRSTTVGHE